MSPSGTVGAALVGVVDVGTVVDGAVVDVAAVVDVTVVVDVVDELAEVVLEVAPGESTRDEERIESMPNAATTVSAKTNEIIATRLAR
jgi:hypothetical protein